MPIHCRLSQPPPPDQPTLPGDVRAEGRALRTGVVCTEPTVEKDMSHVLAQEHPPGWAEDGERVPKRLVAVWLGT
jgi:hypothetical protein